jgi:NAD(P)-dependent dehydrogenase (short-subunit alcohol dehydrogenase family)
VGRYGRLDVGINNVGNMGKADVLGVRVHDSTWEGFESTLEVSLKTTFLCMKHEIQQMLKQGGGVIANTTSMAGVRITEHSSPGYTAAKAGVVHLTRYAAVLYAKDNIRVNVIAPGLTETPAVVGAFPTAAARKGIASAFHPMERMMSPEELADAFLWVCSSQASGITGLTIPVDGGWNAR